jgi:hypothetical protein
VLDGDRLNSVTDGRRRGVDTWFAGPSRGHKDGNHARVRYTPDPIDLPVACRAAGGQSPHLAAEGGKYSIRISGRPGIDVVEASQHRPLDHGSFATRASRQRALETEAPVWPVVVVVVEILGEERMQVLLVDDDRVVQTLRAN